MEAIADALVFAVAYINGRTGEDPESEDDDERDVNAMESIAAFLRAATPAEEGALAAAAERALTEERSAPRPRPELLHVYEHWMENMFGEGWQGNRRVAEE